MSKYWQGRFDQIEQAANNKSVKYTKKLEKKYNSAAQEIDKQINAWYKRIAKNNEVSITDAKKLLSKSELAEFKWTVEEYIDYGRRNAMDQFWMKELENASAKFHISRLEAMKLDCRQQVEQLFAGGQETMFDVLADTYSDTFYRSCFEIQKGVGVGFDVSKLDSNQVSKLLMKPWSVDGTNFSQKLWGNKSKLINTLDKELSRMILTGESPDKAIKAIRTAMGSSLSSAKRLVLTEQAYFTSMAQKDAYAELDVEEYEFVGTLDGKTCDDCGQLDGKHFPMKDMIPGVNAAPMHPYCRCTTAPYFNDEFTNGKRIAKNKDDEYYEVPEKMTYEEWKNTFKDGGSKDDLTPVVTPQKPTFVPANTIEEAEEFIKKYVDEGTFGALGVSYKGIDLEVANEVNRTLSNLFETYDVGKFGGIIAPTANSKLGQMINNATAAYSPVRNSFILNRQSLKNMKTATKAFASEREVMQNFFEHPERYDFNKLSKRVREVIERSKVSGRATVPDTIEEALQHEFGHMIEKKVYDSPMWEEALSNMGKYADNISGYAGESTSEYIAESFVSYTKGEELSDPIIVKIFESLKR